MHDCSQWHIQRHPQQSFQQDGKNCNHNNVKKKKTSFFLHFFFPWLSLCAEFAFRRASCQWEGHHRWSIHTGPWVNRWVRDRLHWLGLGLDAPPVSASRLAQVSEELRVDEPGVGVVLHQAVNFPLRRHEASGRGLLEALDDGVFGLEVQVDLERHQSNSVSLQLLHVGLLIDHLLTSAWNFHFVITSLGASLLMNSS